MSIKIAHTHDDGKVCFTSNKHFKDVAFFEINGKECLIGFRFYTAHWYCYDPQTGIEIANFTNEFYSNFIQQYRVSSLINDPNCF